jgi:hypothetical protein
MIFFHKGTSAAGLVLILHTARRAEDFPGDFGRLGT